MKKPSILFIFCFILLTAVKAQIPPAAFNYSAVARNAQNNPIANSTIGIQITILKTSPTGASQYSENHFVNTDQFGLFNLTVGAGAVQSGSMSAINWSSDNYYLKVGMDANGGTNFLTMGTTQLLSVPYALYAKSAGSVGSGGGGGGDSVIGTPLFTPGGGVTDIDGNQYPTVKIGSQEWMAINLKTTKFRNGDLIANVTDLNLWVTQTSGAWCYYDNNSANNAIYGKLYDVYAVSDSRNVCPSGWHVPSDANWNQLINFIDPYNGQGGQSSTYAGGAMKSTGTLQKQQGLWQHPNTEATNISGFKGVPGGTISYSNFKSLGVSGCWWRYTNINTLGFIILNSDNAAVSNFDWFSAGLNIDGGSVRCVKD